MVSNTLFEFDRRLRSPRLRFSEAGHQTSDKVAFLSGKNSTDFCLVGIDEAGRGPWAGPVVAGAVVLSSDFFAPELNDSKKLSPKQRLNLFKNLRQKCYWAIGTGSVKLIDSKNILRATFHAMQCALRNLLRKNPHLNPQLILVDGPQSPDLGFPSLNLIRGDERSASIAAASVIAKVCRDQMMLDVHNSYPQYGFAAHKGYGTKLHRKKLVSFGPSPIHRRSFSPVREALALGKI